MVTFSGSRTLFNSLSIFLDFFSTKNQQPYHHHHQMEGLFFNIDYGYLEGVVRGYKSGLLTSNQYVNLTQCDNLEDLKLQLSSTDYGNFLANYSGPLSTTVIQENLTKTIPAVPVHPKSIEEVNQIYGFHKLRVHDRQCHIDDYRYLTRKRQVGNLEKDQRLGVVRYLAYIVDCYRHRKFIPDSVDRHSFGPILQNCVSADDLDDLNIEIIRNRLYKNYLEGFVDWCDKTWTDPIRRLWRDC